MNVLATRVHNENDNLTCMKLLIGVIYNHCYAQERCYGNAQQCLLSLIYQKNTIVNKKNTIAITPGVGMYKSTIEDNKIPHLTFLSHQFSFSPIKQ